MYIISNKLNSFHLPPKNTDDPELKIIRFNFRTSAVLQDMNMV